LLIWSEYEYPFFNWLIVFVFATIRINTLLQEVGMKKDLREWIDKEVDRLDKEVEGEKPEETESNPVPDELRQALGKTSGIKSSETN